MTGKASFRHYGAGLLLVLGVLALVAVFSPLGTTGKARLRGRATVADRVAQYGPTAQARWQLCFARKKLAYPPKKVLLVGLKREKQLQVYAKGDEQAYRLVRTLPILRSSGKLGPKLRYGDYQVPEGFYQVESLNPNSAYHLALRVNYPNALDRAQAAKENRTNLGGDIMIHGSNVSVGCLAMGDEAAEDLFVLAAAVGAQNTDIILSPVDFRTATVPDAPPRPAWVTALYANLKAKLGSLPRS